MAGKTAYKNDWQKENKERINLVVDKGYKEKARAAATMAVIFYSLGIKLYRHARGAYG